MRKPLPTKRLRPGSYSSVRIFITRDGTNVGRAIYSRISEGGYDMKSHYTVIKIIANLPETVKYSLGGPKEREQGLGLKQRKKALGGFGPGPGSLQFASHTALSYRLEQNQTG